MKRRLLSLMLALLAACPAAIGAKRPRVCLETSLGQIVIELFNETPRHRDNFLKLVSEGYYDGLLFHRVIEDFMIQTGDPDSRNAPAGKKLGDGGPDYTLPIEIGLPYFFHCRGAVAAAREGDETNPKRESSGSQFYIVWGKRYSTTELQKMRQHVQDMTGGAADFTEEMENTYRRDGGTPFLDGQYTVFGRVVKGLKIVDRIQQTDTDANDRPMTDIRIIRATIVGGKKQ